MLYPRESESRQLKDLSGVWRFQIDPGELGFAQCWHKQALPEPIEMPVPASFNDLTQDVVIRDHVGYYWYQCDVFVPASWRRERVVLRVGSVCHEAIAYVNDVEVARHRGGYLPFEAEVSDHLHFGRCNRITIAATNTLHDCSLPRGATEAFDDDIHPPGYSVTDIRPDFYNFGGIHRLVRLYTTPSVYVDDITVTTDIDGTDGVVNYEIAVGGGEAQTVVRLLDAAGNCVAGADTVSGCLRVENANLWRPGNGYQYDLEITATAADGDQDVYRLPVGIRTVAVTGEAFLINGEPVYLQGVNKHEDADLVGKGHNDAVNVKDFALMKWIGANIFRTSHYPYAEEIMNMADRQGVLVMAECPAGGYGGDPEQVIFTEERLLGPTQKVHIDTMRELIARDKNHPCVVMWSLANEPSLWDPLSAEYFEPVAEAARGADPAGRPLTIVTCAAPTKTGWRPSLYEQGACEFVDVLCVNRYFSWYDDPGRFQLIEYQLESDLRAWHERYPDKPLILSEYGVDTICGFHQDPPVMYTEEYQCEFLTRCHRVLDELPFVIGELIWCFTDFATKQEIRRIVGNRKGVFTRQRQPKAAAHLLRQRWAPHWPSGSDHKQFSSDG